MKYIIGLILFTGISFAQVDTLKLDTVRVMYLISSDSLELVKIDSILLADMKAKVPSVSAVKYSAIHKNLQKSEWALAVDINDTRLPFKELRSIYKIRVKRTLPDKYFEIKTGGIK